MTLVSVEALETISTAFESLVEIHTGTVQIALLLNEERSFPIAVTFLFTLLKFSS